MIIKTQETKYNIDNFLKLDNVKSFNIDTTKKDLRWIYKLTNIKNNKIYIGKTKNIHRRATEYIAEYENKTGKRRIIWEDIQKFGIENFYMEPIDFCYGAESAAIKELYYIDLLQAMDPKIGYNMSYQSVTTPDTVKNYTPRTQTANERMRRSKIICAINPNEKLMYISTGLKLFGDIINRNKDEIKSAAKRSMPIEGFYLYYIDNETFMNHMVYAYDIIYNKNNEYRTDYIPKYLTYLQCGNNLVDILVNSKNPDNYSILFIHQDDVNPKGYIYDNTKIFFDYYKELLKNGFKSIQKTDLSNLLKIYTK